MSQSPICGFALGSCGAAQHSTISTPPAWAPERFNYQDGPVRVLATAGEPAKDAPEEIIARCGAALPCIPQEPVAYIPEVKAVVIPGLVSRGLAGCKAPYRQRDHLMPRVVEMRVAGVSWTGIARELGVPVDSARRLWLRAKKGSQ